jgi:hypothetical protein
MLFKIFKITFKRDFFYFQISERGTTALAVLPENTGARLAEENIFSAFRKMFSFPGAFADAAGAFLESRQF